MFSEIVHCLFPDYCKVIHLGESKFVFPIMKNGTTTFEIDSQTPGHGMITNHDISKIQHPITVFVRNPKSRFISGVNTYLQQAKRDNPNLDEKTILYFVNKYLFLNLHYCPQFFWLVNLSRYLSPDAKLEIKSMDDIGDYTKISATPPGITPPTSDFMEQIKQFDWEKLELYFYLDQQLEEFVGFTVTWDEILNKVKSVPVLNELIFEKTFEIAKICGARD